MKQYDSNYQTVFQDRPLGNNPYLHEKIKGGVWCVMCALSELLSDLLEFHIYPLCLELLLMQLDGFVIRSKEYLEAGFTGDEVIWKSIEKIKLKDSRFEVEPDFSSKARDPNKILKFPAIISIDFSSKTGYQGHFLYAKKGRYFKDELVDFYVFDPYYDGWYWFKVKYGSINKVYSIINIRKQDGNNG